MHVLAAHVPRSLIHESLARRHFLLFSSRMAPADFREFFSGTGFTDRAIVWGEEGAATYRRAHPGRRLSMDLVDGGFTIGETFGAKFALRTDPMGQDALYLWRAGADWAVSNSLYVLAREVEALGHVPKLYPPALAIFSAGPMDRDHGQIVSRNTALDGAILVPSNYVLWISFEHEAPRLEMLKSWDFEVGPRNSGVYLHRLVNFISLWRDRLLTLSQYGLRQNLSLSGGKDSRTVLAMMLSVPGLRVHANTWADRAEDFPIATAIMQEQGLDNSFPSGRYSDSLSGSENFALNMMSGAGVRRFNYMIMDELLVPGVGFVGGAGFDARTLRSPLTRRIENARNTTLIEDPALRDALIGEYRQGAQDIPGGLESEHAILFHYGAYRGRLHYGRKSLSPPVCHMMPLFSRPGSEAVLSTVNQRYIRMSGINYDLISLCAPDLLRYPFTGALERPLLASRDLSLADLPEPQCLTMYGTPTPGPVPPHERVDGPGGLALLRAGLEQAISKFGRYFAAHVIEAARSEIAQNRPLSACRNAGLICGLDYIFPDP